MRQLALILGTCLTTISWLITQPLLAESPSIPSPSDAPLELDLLTNPRGSIITANIIDQGKLSVPSLWWIKEISENKLLDNWIAYPFTNHQTARVDVIVNQQIWSLLDYLERYDFVNNLGDIARSYGYNIRVFNYQKESLASYTCNFDTNPLSCKIKINSQNNFGLGNSL
ncbi:hypothetical protein NIES592_16970 [Fischerella major NIES-592]|uniref:Uncharacterized protein n=2 Tax=Fischerella TaxID=1190 RepID=A0A1U7GWD2_9CYAN|nr:MULTISPECIES: hypothetical protein [Fischerella]OKH12539.1 hypothetical protein NIES592_16970 [Fischerella major NIES-592]PMB45841.1 hypothetical protein CEN41_07365 [Fischerella thermalis CCMEE 5330]BAU05575.1 hypothetical protein FIS3754_14740 [Fischerella sp. NIES-3754]BCX07841.1 MAG: hypothetical protein KatS3mg066_1700 [Fischerella sp.]